MKTIRPFLAAALLSLAGGCATTVHSSTSPNANLTRYRTFAFYTSPYKHGLPPTVRDQEIRAAITRDLEQKGLLRATDGHPDMVIAFHARTVEMPNYSSFGYSTDCCGVEPMATYPEGTLIVDFIDPHTGTVFWRGSAKRMLHSHPDPQHPNVAKLDQSVAKLIARYPAQLAAVPRATF
jgi:hypothetical protein